MSLVLLALLVWAGAWALNARLTAGGRERPAARALVPAIFGLTILLAWELLVRGLDVPAVILPPPSAIGRAFAANLPLLWGDFVQTILKGALSGLAIGVGLALVTAILVDRFGWLRRGLLPVASLLAALPIVGTAPILVMWFGFGWQSKAAVVVLMVFFPMLVNLVAGLADTTPQQRDLMRTYGAGYWATLRKLRAPAALPFAFNGLKVASTLAMIGAIVAEFFGSPTQGIGFRISASNGRLALDMVWAAILVAALAGSAAYGIITLAERRATFWHPSQRT
jgi:NitT/TauT family transport system permease protein